jgi:hypothetical protein
MEEKMKSRPDAKTIRTIKDAASKLTGAARREFQAAVTLDHCHGSPRFARAIFGWNSESIRKGQAEREGNCVILDKERSGRPAYIGHLEKPLFNHETHEISRKVFFCKLFYIDR